jgi:hypothetical protein
VRRPRARATPAPEWRLSETPSIYTHFGGFAQ